LVGTEPESYAICKGDQPDKGQDVSTPSNWGNTLSERTNSAATNSSYMPPNPPFGVTGRKSKAASKTTTNEGLLTDALARDLRSSDGMLLFPECT